MIKTIEIDTTYLEREISITIKDTMKFINEKAKDKFINYVVDEILKLENVKKIKGFVNSDIVTAYHNAMVKILEEGDG